MGMNTIEYARFKHELEALHEINLVCQFRKEYEAYQLRGMLNGIPDWEYQFKRCLNGVEFNELLSIIKKYYIKIKRLNAKTLSVELRHEGNHFPVHTTIVKTNRYYRVNFNILLTHKWGQFIRRVPKPVEEKKPLFIQNFFTDTITLERMEKEQPLDVVLAFAARVRDNLVEIFPNNTSMEKQNNLTTPYLHYCYFNAVMYTNFHNCGKAAKHLKLIPAPFKTYANVMYLFIDRHEWIGTMDEHNVLNVLKNQLYGYIQSSPSIFFDILNTFKKK